MFLADQDTKMHKPQLAIKFVINFQNILYKSTCVLYRGAITEFMTGIHKFMPVNMYSSFFYVISD